MVNISRRSFLQRSTAAAAALTIVPGTVLGKRLVSEVWVTLT